MFTVKIADLTVGIDNRFSYVEEISRDYLTQEEPLFILSANDGDIEYEKKLSEEDFPIGVFESTAIYRKMAEKLTEYDAFIFHGAVIEYKKRAYLFTAKSGVGKTTHVRLWHKRFPKDVSVLNGDKPIIRLVNGEVFAAGTPWRGKEGYGKPGMLPLSGIAFLERGENNEAYPVKSDEVLLKFATQAYIPRTEGAGKILALFDKILARVPLVALKCNMNPDAADVALKAFLEAETEKLFK